MQPTDPDKFTDTAWEAVIVVRPGLKTLIEPVFCADVIVAMLVSDELKVHAAGEFDDGARIVKVLAVVGDWV